MSSNHRQAEPVGLRRALLGSALGLPLAALGLAGAAPARAAGDGRILVVFEMSGGNDGLNTVVPYADDEYYRLRPHLGIPAAKVRRLDDYHGLSPGMSGFERLYHDGHMAIVHGCGYAQPSFSHFSSMAYWHTAAPNSGEQTGWVGRMADLLRPQPEPGYLVNIAATQSLAVRSLKHVPVVFDDPERFVRVSEPDQAELLDRAEPVSGDPNPMRSYLRALARSAHDISAQVRSACASYRTPVDYGVLALDLNKVAALIAAGLPTRLYYVSFRNNAFDTHVHQADTHSRLITYVSDAVSAFLRDMERIGRADDVVLMAFSEFGRRVPENANLGTDHGTAGPMFIAGRPVRGGQYGQPVSLSGRDADDNLRFTTDFRRVYASVAEGWLGVPDAGALLRGHFETFPIFS